VNDRIAADPSAGGLAIPQVNILKLLHKRKGRPMKNPIILSAKSVYSSMTRILDTVENPPKEANGPSALGPPSSEQMRQMADSMEKIIID
jgi:hypothetical protein